MSIRHRLETLFVVVEGIITAALYPFCLLRERLAGQAGIPILMYHQISRPPEGADPGPDCVTPARFEIQARALARSGYHVVPLRDLVSEGGLRGGRVRRHAALTFDDGYRDQQANALPLLRRHRFPATFFLVAGSIGRTDVLPHLAPRGTPTGAAGLGAGWLPLTWEQVGELAAAGVSIGSHALTHRSLGSLPLEEAGLEVRRSREILEERLGAPVDLFAYPFGSEAYGDSGDGVRTLLRRAGYRAACTTVVGRNRPGGDPLALRRIPIEERDGPFRIRCKLSGAYDWVGVVKSIWQRLARREERVDATWVDSSGDRRARATAPARKTG